MTPSHSQNWSPNRTGTISFDRTWMADGFSRFVVARLDTLLGTVEVLEAAPFPFQWNLAHASI